MNHVVEEWFHYEFTFATTNVGTSDAMGSLRENVLCAVLGKGGIEPYLHEFSANTDIVDVGLFQVEVSKTLERSFRLDNEDSR